MYQGISRGDLAQVVDDLHALMIGVEPDLTFLIDLPAEVGLARAQSRAGAEMRFEDMGLALQSKMRSGFLALAAQHPRFAVIDGTQSQDDLAAQILAVAQAHLAQAGPA
jgi:dTMP kinase